MGHGPRRLGSHVSPDPPRQWSGAPRQRVAYVPAQSLHARQSPRRRCGNGHSAGPGARLIAPMGLARHIGYRRGWTQISPRGRPWSEPRRASMSHRRPGIPFADSLCPCKRGLSAGWTDFWESAGLEKKQAALPAAALLSWVFCITQIRFLGRDRTGSPLSRHAPAPLISCSCSATSAKSAWHP